MQITLPPKTGPRVTRSNMVRITFADPEYSRGRYHTGDTGQRIGSNGDASMIHVQFTPTHSAWVPRGNVEEII
jgi:hypothetical protein